MFVFFISRDPESDIQLWLYHRVEERDYEARLSKSSKDVFLLGEENSLSQIIQGYTLKNASADIKGFALKRKTIYCFFK